MTDVGNYSILAEYTSGGNYTVSNNTGTLTIQPANLEDETATTDADFRHVDGVDALFKKDGNLTTLRLQNTNPGTVHYQLTLKNVTGVVIDAATGSTAKTILEVPAITSCGGILLSVGGAQRTGLGAEGCQGSARPSGRQDRRHARAAQLQGERDLHRRDWVCE